MQSRRLTADIGNMFTKIRIGCGALLILVAVGCADSEPSTSRQATTPESTTAPTTTTTLAPDVAETGFLVTTTTVAPPTVDACDVPPDPTRVPAEVRTQCDAGAGWRISAWIGLSGDGIILLEQHVDDAWTDVAYGPFCGGVAAITTADLRSFGVPGDLAESWGYDAEACAAYRS